MTDFAPAVPSVEMVGFIARSEKSRASLAAAGIGADRIFSSLAEAARATGAELLINATKTPEHYPLIGEALELGLHVLTEKPLASTVAQAKELVALAAANGRFLGVAENYRFFPAAMEAYGLMRKGMFRSPTRIRVDFRKHLRTMGFEYPYPEIAHPVLADYGIHLFELMRWLLADEPIRVSARSWNVPGNGLAGDPIALATAEFARGTIATLDGSYLSTGRPTPWGGEWTMDMAEGEIWWSADDGGGRLVLTPLGGVAEDVPLPSPVLGASAGALHATVRAIETGTPPPDFIAGSDNIKSLALSEAAVRSASRRGDWVDVAEVLK